MSVLSDQRVLEQVPRFTRSTLPDAANYQDVLIIIVEPDGSRGLWRSNGATWLAIGPTSAALSITESIAVSGQTVFPVAAGYAVGLVLVHRNGALYQSSNYTATNGTSIILNSPASAGDEFKVVSFGTSSALAIGAASVSAQRTDLPGSVPTDQSAMNLATIIDVGPNFGYVTGRGMTAAQRIVNANAIIAADAAAAIIGGQIRLPAGPSEIDCGAGSLKPSYGVEWYGHGTLATNIWDYTQPGGVTLDLLGPGTGTPPADRIITTVGRFTLWGDNAGAARQGMRFGYNYRSSPLTSGLSIQNYGHYGVNEAGNSWDTSHDHIQVAGCGRRTNNSSGIYRDPSVTDANDVTWYNPKVEGNGSPGSSAAGGWNMQSPPGGTNRGFNIIGGATQGNAGTVEALFTNMHGMAIIGHYVERTSVSGQVAGFEFDACDGVIYGGTNAAESITYDMNTTNTSAVMTFVWTTETAPQKLAVTNAVVVGVTVRGTGVPTGATVASVQASVGFTLNVPATVTGAANMRYGFALYGHQFKASSRFEVAGLLTSGYLTADIDNQGAIVTTRNMAPATTYRGDASAQYLGDYAPCFAAFLSADQTGVVSGVFTKLQCNSTLYDITGAYDKTTNYRVTPKTIREYHVAGAVTFSTATDQDELIVAIYKNGVLYKLGGRVRTSGTGSHTVPINTEIQVGAVGDYFEIFVRHTSGANKIITSGVDTHWGLGLAR